MRTGVCIPLPVQADVQRSGAAMQIALDHCIALGHRGRLPLQHYQQKVPSPICLAILPHQFWDRAIVSSRDFGVPVFLAQVLYILQL